ncbi:MAG: Ig-like domain-containing protein [Muribaculaceae bacterium]|nr:Ig-like domain-containing protein [Muribaculaceae bacterium]
MKKFISLNLKKLSFALALAASAIQLSAQIGDDGYYRVQNTVTDRYIYITDNKGKINMSATTIDALAIQLWKGDEKAMSDPSTVLYFQKKSQGHVSADYDITSQGTGIYQIIGRYVTIMKTGNAYFAYGRDSGVTKYLGDANASNDPEGSMSSEVAAPGSGQPDRRKWYIKPVSTSGDNYFGAMPKITVAGKRYAPMYASFPFSAHSAGLKIYTVTTCAYGMAVADEVSGTIPANTACFIECPSASPSGNRLNVGGTGQAVSGNKLEGVFFENYMNTHLNLTPYDRNTMRMLGTMPDGSLGFVTADISYLPANQCYLRVPADSPANIKVVSRAEYDAAVAAMPKSISLDPSSSKIYEGSTLQLNAVVAPSTASTEGLSWASSNAAVATVSATGLVKAVGKGTAKIIVTTINGLTASCDLTVAPKYPEAVSVSPATLKLYAGESSTLSATISPADVELPTLTWSSSDASVASVGADGTVKALKTGNVTVTATSGNGKAASCALTVAPYYPESIRLNTSYVSIFAGQETTLSATIVPGDVKDPTLTWSSSNEAVASVDNGKVTALKSGDAVITVSSPGGASATCNISVRQPLPEELVLSPSDVVIETGDKFTLRVSAIPSAAVLNVKWTSSDESIVAVSGSGRSVAVTAMAEGEATITATSTDNNVSSSCKIKVLKPGVPATAITITPRSLSLLEGESEQLTATIEPADASNKFIIWTSNNESIARVDANGRVTAVGASNAACIITAQCGKVSRTATVRVNRFVPIESIKLSQSEISLEKGESVTLTATILPENATNKYLSWQSSNENVATVDGSGKVTIVSSGSAVISAYAVDGSGVYASCTVLGTAGINDALLGSEGTVSVYTLDGVLLHQAADAETLRTLSPGYYIIGNKKVLIN